MSRFMLSFTARLQNLTSLQPKGGWDSDEGHFTLTVTCSGCARRTEVDVYATSNLTMTCPTCNKVGELQAITGYGKPLTNESSVKEERIPALLLECRNLVPVEVVDFNGAWEAKSTVNITRNYEFDLVDGDHSDYDEDNQTPIAVLNMQLEVITKYLDPNPN